MPRRNWKRIVIDDDPDVIELHADGRRTQGLMAVFCDEDIDAMRTGYKCIACWENLDNAFPEECPVCGFPMKALQSARFAQTYKGHKPMGSQIDWDKEAESLEREAYERNIHSRASRSNIVVPRSIV